MSIAVHEVCKVRSREVGRGGVGYTIAVFKRMKNKTTAHVVVFDDWMTSGDKTMHTVQLNTLWKMKRTQRASLERKMRNIETTPSVVPTPSPLFVRVDLLDTTFMGTHVVAKLNLNNSSTVMYIAHDSVVGFTGDAIVNAANTGCLGGGGIDGEINFRGGSALEEARKALPMLDNFETRCDTGDAKITIAGDLPCKNVIHAVGPRFDFGDIDHSQNLNLLEDAYKNSLERAREANLKTIGFCLLSAGIFRGSCPLSVIVQTAIDAIARHAYNGLDAIVLCGFTFGEQQELMASVYSIQKEIA